MKKHTQEKGNDFFFNQKGKKKVKNRKDIYVCVSVCVIDMNMIFPCLIGCSMYIVKVTRLDPKYM